MKKAMHIKAAALVLVVLMMVQLLGASGISMISAAASSTGTLYETAFNDSFNTLKATGLWAKESWQKNDATEPTVENGVVKFDTKDSVKFNWTQVDGVGAYSTNKRYTFEFDVKPTDFGSGFGWNSENHTRLLYVAFGGWYNQIEINDKNSKVRAGDTYVDYSTSNVNKTLHCKLFLEGDTVSSYVYDESGNVISSGSRTNSNYTSMTAESAAMTYLVLRCEDGAFELDNFSFSVKAASQFGEVSKKTISIPSGKQAIYTAKVTHVAGERTVVKLGDSELFNISDTAMKVCGGQVYGTYGEGVYGIKLYINPTQKMLLAEITLPDGGVVRRGTYDRVTGSAVSISAMDANNVKDVAVAYESISVADYTVTNREPSGNSKIYNIVSSFSDAQTNRLFAWTAKASFIGSDAMAVKYREKGAGEWLTVDATKTAEPTNVSAEDYFKAEISGLRADTEYEYKVGKKNSTADTDWSDTYNFTTAPEKIKEFSFIAFGDPQGNNWNTFKYAKAALDQAFKEIPNPAFILNTGDVVDSGYRPAEWTTFFKALGKYGTNFANFTAIGNHDTRNDANVQSNTNKNNYFGFYFNHPDAPSDALVMDQKDYNKLSDSGKVQVNSFNETLYSYNYGEAHFVVLNSGTYVNTGNETYPDDALIFEAQRAWLRKDLEANKDAKWTIIMTHEAIYHRKGGKQDRTTLADLIEEYGVDLVIEGHSHLVTRTYPMKNGEIATKTSPDLIQKGTGTVYVTIGATTTGHDTVGDYNVECMQTIITPDSAQPVYSLVTVKGTDLIFTIKQIDGLVVDSFTIRGTEDFGAGLDDTTQPPVTDEATTEAPDTEPSPEKKGCKGSVSLAGVALVAALTTCTVFVAKKKED